MKLFSIRNVIDKPYFKSAYEKYMIFAGVLGQIAVYAQAYKIFQTKAAGDLSLLSFLLSLISAFSWFIYGLVLKNNLLIVTNLIGTIGVFLVIIGILVHS